MSVGLKDKVILITGAGRGLGLAYAQVLARHGARLAMHDGGVSQTGVAPNPAVILSAVAGLGDVSPDILPLAERLDGPAACQALIDKTVQQFGRLDGVIHNAGLVLWRDIAEVDAATYRTNAEVNHEAAFWLCKSALPVMRDQGYGRIFLASSGWALTPWDQADQLTLYAHSKGAQYGLALAHGAGHPDIRTNIIVPVAKTRVSRNDVLDGTLRPDAVAGAASWLVPPQCQLSG